jgi:hypothetical protein
VTDKLGTVADAENWQTAHEAVKVYLECLWIMHGIRRAGKDNADNVLVILRVLIVRHDFTERVKLTNTTSNELSGLTAKV